MSNENEEEVQRIQALAQNKQHIRKQALLCAGYELQGGDTLDRIIQRQLAQLDDTVGMDADVNAAYEEMITAIGDEVVKIGEELVKQVEAMKS